MSQDQPPQGPTPVTAATSAPAPPRQGDPGDEISRALSWTWDAFRGNLAALLISGLIYAGLTVALIVGMVVLAVTVLAAGPTRVTAAGSEVPTAGTILGAIGAPLAVLPLLLVVSLLWSTGMIRAAHVIREGGRPTVAQTLIGPWRVILTAVLCSVGSQIGLLLGYVPGILFSFICTYALVAAMQGAGPIEAISQSARLVRDHLTSTLLMLLVAMVAGSVMAVAPPVIVAVPALSALLATAMHEITLGRELAPPAAAP